MIEPLNDPVFALGARLLPEGRETIFAARQSGLHLSLDRGATWSPVWARGLCASIAVSPTGSIDGLVVAGVVGGVIRSEDGGLTWRFHSFGLPDTLVACLSIASDCDRSGLILAGTIEDGLYRSTDWGKTWLPSNTGVYISRITTVHVHNEHVCLAGTDCGLFVSSNNGKTWDDQIGDPLDVEISAVTSDHDITVIGTASEGIFAWDTTHREWRCLPQSRPNEETIALTIRSKATLQKEIIAITSTMIQRYCLETEETGMVVNLVSTTPLPISAGCAAIFSADTVPRALVGGENGDVLLVPLCPLRQAGSP